MNDAGHSVDEEQVGRELAAGFRRLMEPEPPFRAGLEKSLIAAARESRRRRARRRSVRGGAAVLAMAASAAVFLNWPDQNRALPPPPALVVPTSVAPTTAVTTSAAPTAPLTEVPSTAAVPAGKPSPPVTPTRRATRSVAPTTAVPLTPMDQLEALAREIARPAGGSVTVDRDAELSQVTVSVTTSDGTFEVSAGLDPDNGVETWRESCRLEGSNCTEVSYTPTVGVWAWTRTSPPGRERLSVVAEMADGRSLSALVENYVETASGAKVVGPTWKEAGLTPAGMRKAVTGSPLVD